MDVRDVGVALWRQRPLVTAVLVAAGAALAGLAQEPVGRRHLPLLVGAGVLVGLAATVAAAVLRDRLGHRIEDAAELEQAASSPLLAHLAPPRDLTSLPALHPGTADADLFRHLRLTLEDQAAAGRHRVVLAGVTGGEVTTWVGANLALALATAGRRVLLVDGRLGEAYGVPAADAPGTPGLYDVLMGVDLRTALTPGPVDLLRALPAGRCGEVDVPDLLDQRFVEVMDAAGDLFDHVVVLGPPLELSADSRAMARDGGMIVTVVEGAVTPARLRRHADRIRAAGARLLGAVLVAREPDRRAG